MLEQGTSFAKMPRAVNSATNSFMISAGPDMVAESTLLWHATSMPGGHSGRICKNLSWVFNHCLFLI